MREPIRKLFEVWETTDDIVHSDSAQMLVDLIGRELPKGATIEDVNEHIRQHYRKGVDIFDGKWSRSNSKGYIFPWLDVKIVRACWNPGDFLEGGSVQVHYVVFEGAYLRTEIQFVGWKGHPHPQIIKIVAVEEPNDGGQVGADQPATALELKAK